MAKNCYAYTEQILDKKKHIVKFSEEQLYNLILLQLETNPELKNSGFDVAVYSKSASSLDELILLSLRKKSNNYTATELSEFIGVNKFNQLPTTADHDRIVPEYNEANYFQYFKEDLLKKGKTEAEINELWEKDLFDRLLVLHKGIAIHSLLEGLFANEELSHKQLAPNYTSPTFHDHKVSIINEINKQSNIVEALAKQGLTVETFVNQLAKLAIIVHNGIVSKYNPKLFFTELRVTSEAGKGVGKNKYLKLPTSISGKYKGIQGIIDLCFVDDEGYIHIIDYKLSSHSYGDWNQVKTLSVYALLVAYKRILQAAGISGDKIKLEIIPMIGPNDFMSEASLDEKCMPDGIESFSPIDVTDTAEAYRKVGAKLSKYIYSLSVAETRVPTDDKIAETIDNDSKTILSPEIEEHEQSILDKESLREKVLERKGKLTPSGEDTYQLFDLTTGEIDEFTLKELDTKNEDGKDPLDLYIERYKNFKKSAPQLIYNKLKHAKEHQLDRTELVFFEHGFVNQNANLVDLFAPYLNEDWELITNIPELLDNNIIAFKYTVEGQEKIALICLTEMNLDSEYKVAGRFNLGGNFVSDIENNLKKLGFLSSQGKYITGAKALLIANRLKSNITTNIFLTTDGMNIPICALTVVLNGLYNSVDLRAEMTKIERNVADLIYLANENPELQEKIPNTVYDKQQLVMGGAEAMTAAILEVAEVIYENSKTKKKKDANELFVETLLNRDTSIISKELALIQLINNIKKMDPKRYRAYDEKSLTSLDVNNKLDRAYLFANRLLISLRSQYGVSIDAGIADYALGINFLGQALCENWNSNGASPMHLSNGTTDTGLVGGFMTTSIDYSPDNAVKYLTELSNRAMQSCRSLLFKLGNIITKILEKWDTGLHHLFRYISGTVNPVKDYKRFFVHNSDGKIDNKLILKNPYVNSCDLELNDREYLEAILWEINKYRDLNISSEMQNMTWEEMKTKHPKEVERIKRLDSNDEWFFAPLAKATMKERIMGNSRSIKLHIRDWYEDQRKAFDFNDTVVGHPYRSLNLEITDVINLYNISRTERTKMINANPDPSVFTLDLEFLAYDVASYAIREKEYYPVLMHALALMLAIKSAQENNPKEDYSKTQRRIMYVVNEVLKGISTESPELNEIKKGLSVVQSMTSKMMLWFRPAAYAKEILYGITSNIIKGLTTKGGSNEISIKEVVEAASVVFGSGLKLGSKEIGGLADVNSLNLTRALNRLYGIAMQDVATLSYQNTHRGKGIDSAGYWAYSSSDFINRMTLFVAKMMHDGCWEAHELLEDGILKYDWKKDKRFSLLALYGLNANINSEEYIQQRDLYKIMALELELEERDLNGNPIKLVQWNDTKEMYILKDIPRAYTSKQRGSINEMIERVYGSYNHETKAPFVNKFLGHFFFLFLTFITAAWNRWFLKEAKNTSQGSYLYETNVKGEILYEVPLYDTNGKKTGTVKVPESQLSEVERKKYDRCKIWKEDFVEGIFYSFLGTIADITKIPKDPQAWERIKNNPVRLRNLLQGILELLIGCLLAWLIRYIFSEGTNKMKNLNAYEKVLYKAAESVGPLCLTEISTNPAFLTQLGGLASDLPELVMGEDKDLQQVFNQRIGAFRDFYYEEPN